MKALIALFESQRQLTNLYYRRFETLSKNCVFRNPREFFFGAKCKKTVNGVCCFSTCPFSKMKLGKR